MDKEKLKKTHCFELLHLITSNVVVTDLKLVSAVYHPDSLVAVVEDQYNKQQYELILKPIKGGVVE